MISNKLNTVFRGFFYVFGDIKSIVVVHSKRCAFVNFVTRTAAELAAEKVSEIGLNLKGHSLRVVWGRPKPQGPKSDTKKNGKLYNTCPIRVHLLILSFSSILKIVPKDVNSMQPPPPPSMTDKSKYPSQDPTAQGSS